MAYEQQTWVLGLAGGTPLNATRLNYMEQGIADAHTLIADLALNDHTHTSADITDATASNVVDTVVKRDGTGFIAVSGITGLSTATGSTQAVPKSQLDAAIAGVSGAAHTHVLADVTNVTATGTSLATALDAATARTAIDVPSTAEVSSEIDSDVAAEATARTAAISAEATARDAAIATATDFMVIELHHDGTQWPVRPSTTGTNRKVQWVGPSASAIPTTGTSAGGTRAAAPTDKIFYS